MVEIICAIISGIFALISAIFGGITIHCHKEFNKQKINSGNDSTNVQIGEYKHDERNKED